MGDKLMPEEIKVLPLRVSAPFGAPEQATIEGTTFLKAVDWESQVERVQLGAGKCADGCGDETAEREERLHFLIILKIIMSGERKSTNPFDDEVEEMGGDMVHQETTPQENNTSTNPFEYEVEAQQALPEPSEP